MIKEGKLVEEDVEVILKRLLRLVQIASNPYLVDESYAGKACKLEPLKKIVDKGFVLKNRKLLYGLILLITLNELCKQFNLKGCVGIHGGIDVKHRDKLISNFRTNDSIDILITTPGVARES